LLKRAIAAAREGANIVVADLKSDINCKAMQEIKMKILKLFFIDCDVSSYTEIQLTIENHQPDS
jgi:NAD(P)-dependent dehydrogenase (short-subunit alcohol dehydrogenase family)